MSNEMDNIRKRLADQQKKVRDVLNNYMEKNKCPCDWPQFRYWVSKKQGPGWQDGIQNDLIQLALELPIFYLISPPKPEYWLEAEVHCDQCNAKWNYYSEEWRMLAFQKRLIRLDKNDDNFADFPELLISESIFATAGREPHPEIPKLSTDEWEKFMGGEIYRSK